MESPDNESNPNLMAQIADQSFGPPLSYWNFDWDVNLVRMPSKIILFGVSDNDQLFVGNEEWTILRNLIGVERSELAPEIQQMVPQNWHQYQIDSQRSYMRFRSAPNCNFFLEDLKKALSLEPQYWQGHSWDAFLLALSQKETAIRTSIISARGHSREDVFDGLEYLQYFLNNKHAIAIYLPPIENLHMVGQLASPSDEKAKIMLQQIRAIEALPILPCTPFVWDADGKSFQQLHLVGFSDDDFENYQKMLNTLSEAYISGEIVKTKVTLFYTGGSSLQSEVITASGSIRPMLANEDLEYKEYVKRIRLSV